MVRVAFLGTGLLVILLAAPASPVGSAWADDGSCGLEKPQKRCNAFFWKTNATLGDTMVEVVVDTISENQCDMSVAASGYGTGVAGLGGFAAFKYGGHDVALGAGWGNLYRVHVAGHTVVDQFGTTKPAVDAVFGESKPQWGVSVSTQVVGRHEVRWTFGGRDVSPSTFEGSWYDASLQFQATCDAPFRILSVKQGHTLHFWSSDENDAALALRTLAGAVVVQGYEALSVPEASGRFILNDRQRDGRFRLHHPGGVEDFGERGAGTRTLDTRGGPHAIEFQGLVDGSWAALFGLNPRTSFEAIG